jgi:hypothetical protein
MRFITIFFILFLSSSCFGKLKQCGSISNFSKPCLTKLDRVRPTQFTFGSISIEEKISKVEKAFKKGKLDKYYKKKMAPAVLGPNKLIYILDRHHTSLAIYESSISEDKKALFVDVTHDWSKLSRTEFSNKMKEFEFVRLKDEHHNVREFSDLPTHISHLIDDPYRSLAWLVRKEGGFEKVDIPYLEFIWGDFFKSKGIVLNSSNVQEIKRNLKRALKLAKSVEAEHLPGYKN